MKDKMLSQLLVATTAAKSSDELVGPIPLYLPGSEQVLATSSCLPYVYEHY